MHVPIRVPRWLGVVGWLLATTLLRLFTITVASAELLKYGAPIATTIWKAGEDATISWTNTCAGLATTTFPVILLTQRADGVQVPVSGLASLGELNCRSAGSLTIKVPSVIPSGTLYSILVSNVPDLSYSALFTINNPGTPGTSSITTTSGTFTATATSTNGTSTTTIKTSSSTPEPNNDIGPLNGANKSNGAAIGGGIAGAVVVVIAVVVLLVFQRRQKRSNYPIYIKESGADPLPDHVLPSMMNTSDVGAFGNSSQTKPSDKDPVNHTQAPPVDPQSNPSSPHSWPGSFQETKSTPYPVSFSSSPLMPSRPVSSLNPQGYIQGIQQELVFRQEQLANQRSPQYISSDHPIQTFSSPRGPEEADETAFTDSNHELQKQINSLQAELNQLKAKMKS
ncbi:hypothetical protein F5H01DRAFT_358911 [Linnemannia elongata]|nr:hypothetical protein F5H01DRAFT_358911 [Linnemannia elongata]